MCGSSTPFDGGTQKSRGRPIIITFGERRQIDPPAQPAYLLMLEMSFPEQERLRAILLDTKNRLLGAPTI